MLDYVPATRKELGGMTPEQLRKRYDSLKEWMYKNNKVRITEDKDLSEGELIRIILNIQTSNFSCLLADSIERFGEQFPGVLFNFGEDGEFTGVSVQRESEQI